MQTNVPDDQFNGLTNLPEIVPEDLLPPLRLWMRLGGIATAITVGTVLILCRTITYSEIIKAPIIVRPEGELRLVEAIASGQVRDIAVQENGQVQVGDAIAYLDDTALQNQASQLRTTITQLQQQLGQLDNQLQSVQQRTTATDAQIQGTVRANAAELARARQQLQENQLVNQADLRRLQAEVNLAQENVDRYRQLVDQGAIAISQLRDREVALESARANFEKAQVTASPSAANVTIAQQQLAQAKAEGSARLAQLQQETDTLNQQRSNLLTQLNQAQQNLTQTAEDITKLTIKAPVSGIIQSLELRNNNQVITVGESIAEIAAHDDRLVAKAWVAPQDIARIDQQQSVQLRISACPYTDYGTLNAKVQTISPDTVPSDSIPNRMISIAGSLYEITLQLPPVGHQYPDCQLQAGMMGQADILTRKDTILKMVWRKLRLTVQL